MWNFCQNIKLILSLYVWSNPAEMEVGIYWNNVCS